MKPHLHAKNSARRFGGHPGDYQEIHDFIDHSKMCHPDIRHRAIFHSSLGCYLAERVFGITIKNADGKTVSVRDIAENHILEDLNNMTIEPWMSGAKRKELSNVD